MIKREDSGLMEIKKALCKPGSPQFETYPIGQPMLVTFKDNSQVVGYYSGFNQSVIKMGFVYTPNRIFFNLRDHFSRFCIKSTRKLFEEISLTGMSGFLSTPNNLRKSIKELTESSKYNPKRHIIEVSLNDSSKLIGFLGASRDNKVLNLSHQKKRGEYDEWLNPDFIKERDLSEIEHYEIPLPNIDEIDSIAILRPIK